jgi:hypothetical protein
MAKVQTRILTRKTDFQDKCVYKANLSFYLPFSISLNSTTLIYDKKHFDLTERLFCLPESKLRGGELYKYQYFKR